jgi:hypothetical protein
VKLAPNTVEIGECEIADRRDSSMRSVVREVDMIVGTLVRYRVHDNFHFAVGARPWHLVKRALFVAASVRLNGARPWHLEEF